MARRQHLLNSSISVQDAAGTTTVYNLVRIVRWDESTLDRTASIYWELGRINGGQWECPSSLHMGVMSYSGSDYDDLLGQSTPAAMEDKVYSDLVMAAHIGAGTQGNYI